MTVGKSHPGNGRAMRTRRAVLPVFAAVGAWTVVLSGAAPAAVAQGVQDKQWYLDAMQAEKVWEKSTGKGVKIAVVDSGVDPTPSLEGQVLPGEDVSGAVDDERQDETGHGTTMAEIIAGTGKAGGLKGLAQGAEIIPIRTNLKGSSTGSDSYETRAAEAIRAAADSDAKIINMSFGSEFHYAEQKAAVEYAARKGKLLLAGVGNDAKGKNKRAYPAEYRDVVGIGSTNEAGEVSDYSQFGDNVDLTAPGSDIPYYCDGETNRYCDGDGGTSAATALASASAALIWAKHPEWTANQVLRIMIDTAGRESKNKNRSKYIGYGEVRPRMNLVEGEGDPGEATLNPLTDERTGPAKGPSDTSEGSSASDAPTGSTESGDEAKENAADTAEVADSAESGDNSQLWTILGAGAVVVVLGAGAFAVVRKRRG